MGRPGSSIRLRTKHHPLPIFKQDVDRRQSGSIKRKQTQIITPILPRLAARILRLASRDCHVANHGPVVHPPLGILPNGICPMAHVSFARRLNRAFEES